MCHQARRPTAVVDWRFELDFAWDDVLLARTRDLDAASDPLAPLHHVLPSQNASDDERERPATGVAPPHHPLRRVAVYAGDAGYLATIYHMLLQQRRQISAVWPWRPLLCLHLVLFEFVCVLVSLVRLGSWSSRVASCWRRRGLRSTCRF